MNKFCLCFVVLVIVFTISEQKSIVIQDDSQAAETIVKRDIDGWCIQKCAEYSLCTLCVFPWCPDCYNPRPKCSCKVLG